MEREHTELIMQVLETAYPQFYRGKDGAEKRNALRLWHEMFADDDGLTVAAAVKAFIATDAKGFPPAIGQIKAQIVALKHPDMLDEGQAWALVSRAVSRSGYYAEEEFAKLPPVVQRVVGSPAMLKAWSRESMDTLQTVIASNFQRAYRGRAQQEKAYLALPADIRALLTRNDPTQGLPALPDPETQKELALERLAASREAEQRVLRQLAAAREAEQQEILGDTYDQIHDFRDASRSECVHNRRTHKPLFGCEAETTM